MRSSIRRCPDCLVYTLRASCPRCAHPTVLPLPPKYSPEDRWGKYRRRLKYEKREW